VNKPPEYWPESYLPYLGEREPGPLYRRLLDAMAARSRELRTKRRSA